MEWIKIIFISVLICYSSQTFAKVKFSLDYNLISLEDNSSNMAIASNVTYVSTTDTSTPDSSANGMALSLAYEFDMFGLRGKYLLPQDTESKSGQITVSGANSATTGTTLSWNGFGVDAYFMPFSEGSFRPYLGAGYLLSTVKLEQTYTNQSGNFTGQTLNAEADANGLYYFAGLDIILFDGLALGVQYSLHSISIDEFTLTNDFKATTLSTTQTTGSAAKKINSDASGFDEKYTADLTHSAIVISLSYRI